MARKSLTPLEVPDDAYNATSWNGNTEVPTKNAIRDKIETMGGGGDVVGPASSVDNAIARFDSTTGKLIQDSNVFVTDGGDITLLTPDASVDGRDVSADGTKLDTIETNADVTDATNVVAALNGVSLTDVGTPASTDRILLQDASDSNNLKYADFSEFGGGGGSSVINVTVTTARTTAAKVGTTSGGSYTPTAGDRLDVTFTLGISVNNPTLNIDGGGAINITLGTSNVTTSLLSTAASSVVVPLWYDGTNYQIFGSQLNTTYSEISEADITTGTASTARAISGRRAEFIAQKAIAHIDADTDIVRLTGAQTLSSKTLSSPVINTPTGIVKGDVGLGNVDNTSDATKNSATATLTNKTIDGDDNTITDISPDSIKTNVAIGTFNANPGGSTVTISGLSFAPKSVEFFLRTKTANVQTSGQGVATPSAQYATSSTTNSAVTASGNLSSITQSVLMASSASGILVAGSVTSWNSDGFVVTFTTKRDEDFTYIARA